MFRMTSSSSLFTQPPVFLSEFTGKERDAETGLDYFGARYYSGAQGRFTSVDPIGIMKQKLMDPQQWNSYGYARNNPLKFMDPTGMYVVDCAGGDRNCNNAAIEFERRRQKDLRSNDDKVKSAAEAWGDRTTDSKDRIHVKFVSQDQMDKDGGNPDPNNFSIGGMVTPSAGSDKKGQINAEFSWSYRGSDLAQAIAHEGSHIRDDLSFLSSYDETTGKYDASKNFTVFSSEVDAYKAGSGVKPYPDFPRGPQGYRQLEDYVRRMYSNWGEKQFSPRQYPQ
jgi:RHS repeat-associated protein